MLEGLAAAFPLVRPGFIIGLQHGRFAFPLSRYAVLSLREHCILFCEVYMVIEKDPIKQKDGFEALKTLLTSSAEK